MVTSLLATVFLNFSSLCSSPPSDSTDAGGWLHHGGGDIPRAVVGTGSWEEFMLTISPRQGLAECLILSAGLPCPRLLSNGKSISV